MRNLLLVLLLSASCLRAQDSSGISVPKLALVGGLTAGGFVYGHVLQQNMWWKGEKSGFHFDNGHDYLYALNADKCGHFYFPYLVTNIYDQAFRWAGMDSAASIRSAASLALAYQTYIEIRDGFSRDWGFSWGDMAANTLGAGFPVLQREFPQLRNFSFKLSFLPSDKFRRGEHRAIFDDYESSYYWMSVNVHNLLPEEARGYYPPWLNLALGYSVKDLDYRGGGSPEIYLALDWNLEGLPGDTPFLRFLKKNLNFYRLPAPAVRIYPGLVWYGLKF